MHGTHISTRQEYAIKVLDKGHLKRNNKLQTALAEKNTLVRLGSGHPGIVRLHWAFQDDWSLCESATSAVISSVKGKDCHYGWVDTMAKCRVVAALRAVDAALLGISPNGNFSIPVPSFSLRHAVRLP